MSGYTTGPWVVSGGTIYAKALEGTDRNEEGALAVVVQANENAWDDLATAHLIAAAPDMYEALKAVAFSDDEGAIGYIDAMTMVRRAMAKAKGE